MSPNIYIAGVILDTAAPILVTLADEGKPLSVSELHERLTPWSGLRRSTVRSALRILADRGMVERVGRGAYAVSKIERARVLAAVDSA